MPKVYLFFLYDTDKISHESVNPLVKRYHQSDPTFSKTGNENRYLYAWTTNKLFMEIFMNERKMKFFGKTPSVYKCTQREFEWFENKFMGQELERRGIESGRKLVPSGGVGNIIGTCDEFSYVQYDWFNESFNLFGGVEPPSLKLFTKEVSSILSKLLYPISSFYDAEEYERFLAIPEGGTDIIVNEFQLFVKFFSYLYRLPRKGYVES